MDTTRLSAWLGKHATASDDEDALVEGLCHGLTELGLPLWQVSVLTPTIDPAQRGIALNWNAQRGVSRMFAQHGVEKEETWLMPIAALSQNGTQFARWRLDKLETGNDFTLFHELRMQNATEYVLFLIDFAPGTALLGAAFSMVTQRPSGFHDTDIAAVEALLPAFGVAMAKLGLSHTLREVLTTYLGCTTGKHVLNGEIRRGQGEKVSAAILLADLRSFTELTDRADPMEVVGWLNEHFDALGKPVAEQGGEILKFLGDGFLAIFPVQDTGTTPCKICDQALKAAVEALRGNAALNRRRCAAGAPELKADLVLHFGEVVYGNVGTDRRLDFTVIGRAVNEASRIEGHCEILGRALLVSDSFASRCSQPLEMIGTVDLRGLASPQKVWSVPER